MARRKLRNIRARREAAFGADGAVTAGAIALQTASQVAQMVQSRNATIQNAQLQANAQTRAATTQANALAKQNTIATQNAEKQIETQKEAQAENKDIQNNYYLALQTLMGQQNQNDRLEASKIQVRNGGDAGSKNKTPISYLQGGLQGNMPFKVTDGGGVIPVGVTPEGFNLYEVIGNDHNHYHKTKSGKHKTGVGFKFANGSVIEGEGNQKSGQGEYLMTTPNDAVFISKHSINGFNPAQAVNNGMNPLQAFQLQEYIKAANGISDDGKHNVNPPFKKNIAMTGTYLNPLLYNVGLGMPTTLVGANAFRQSLRNGGRAQALNGRDILNYILRDNAIAQYVNNSRVGQALDNAWNSYSNWANGIGNDITGFVNSIPGFVNNIHFNAPRWYGVGTPNQETSASAHESLSSYYKDLLSETKKDISNGSLFRELRDTEKFTNDVYNATGIYLDGDYGLFGGANPTTGTASIAGAMIRNGKRLTRRAIAEEIGRREANQAIRDITGITPTRKYYPSFEERMATDRDFYNRYLNAVNQAYKDRGIIQPDEAIINRNNQQVANQINAVSNPLDLGNGFILNNSKGFGSYTGTYSRGIMNGDPYSGIIQFPSPWYSRLGNRINGLAANAKNTIYNTLYNNSAKFRNYADNASIVRARKAVAKQEKALGNAIYNETVARQQGMGWLPDLPWYSRLGNRINSLAGNVRKAFTRSTKQKAQFNAEANAAAAGGTESEIKAAGEAAANQVENNANWISRHRKPLIGAGIVTGAGIGAAGIYNGIQSSHNPVDTSADYNALTQRNPLVSNNGSTLNSLGISPDSISRNTVSVSAPVDSTARDTTSRDTTKASVAPQTESTGQGTVGGAAAKGQEVSNKQADKDSKANGSTRKFNNFNEAFDYYYDQHKNHGGPATFIFGGLEYGLKKETDAKKEARNRRYGARRTESSVAKMLGDNYEALSQGARWDRYYKNRRAMRNGGRLQAPNGIYVPGLGYRYYDEINTNIMGLSDVGRNNTISTPTGYGFNYNSLGNYKQVDGLWNGQGSKYNPSTMGEFVVTGKVPTKTINRAATEYAKNNKFASHSDSGLNLSTSDWLNIGGTLGNIALNGIGAAISNHANNKAADIMNNAALQGRDAFTNAIAKMHGIDLNIADDERLNPAIALAATVGYTDRSGQQTTAINRQRDAFNNNVRRLSLSSATALQRQAQNEVNASDARNQVYNQEAQRQEEINKMNANNITNASIANANNSAQAINNRANLRLQAAQFNANVDSEKAKLDADNLRSYYNAIGSNSGQARITNGNNTANFLSSSGTGLLNLGTSMAKQITDYNNVMAGGDIATKVAMISNPYTKYDLNGAKQILASLDTTTDLGKQYAKQLYSKYGNSLYD